MKLVVFGSRTFLDRDRMYRILDSALKTKPDLEIISGMSSGGGADILAADWAKARGVVLHEYPADWNSYGKGAGFRRNTQMAEIADVGLGFWDGISRGTAHMRGELEKRKKKVTIMTFVPVVQGDIWLAHGRGDFVVVTTNTSTRKDGTAVMGGGIALAAAQKFPGLDKKYGEHLLSSPDPEKPVYLPRLRVILLPTKRRVQDDSPLDLVEKNILWLKKFSLDHPEWTIALVPLGAGLGRLDWRTQVQPLVDTHLSNGRFTVYKND